MTVSRRNSARSLKNPTRTIFFVLFDSLVTAAKENCKKSSDTPTKKGNQLRIEDLGQKVKKFVLPYLAALALCSPTD